VFPISSPDKAIDNSKSLSVRIPLASFDTSAEINKLGTSALILIKIEARTRAVIIIFFLIDLPIRYAIKQPIKEKIIAVTYNDLMRVISNNIIIKTIDIVYRNLNLK
jgi:hypothetical protein